MPHADGADAAGKGTRFDRNEWAGAFGDIGLDLPLIILLVLTCKLDAASVLILFGLSQIATGLFYRMPVPVQPLKAMAAIAIAGGISGEVLAGGGLAVAALMLVLSLTGGLAWVARVVPKPVVRGLQFGLGLKLAMLALRDQLPALGSTGYVLSAAGLLLVLLLRGNRRVPAAPFVILLGLAYVFVLGGGTEKIHPAVTPALPGFRAPSLEAVLSGLVLLAVPQLALSVGNAVLATRQTVRDLFGREVRVRTFGLTYSIINAIAPLFGGIPVCHGSGGVAGHYAFGGRTGGSVIIYGGMFLVCGALFGESFFQLIRLFPRPLLAVLLVFEGLTLLQLSRDMMGEPDAFLIVMLVGLVGAGVGYGFFIGLVGGTLLHAGLFRRKSVRRQRRVPAAGTELSGNIGGLENA